jgi:hypothetical protein
VLVAAAEHGFVRADCDVEVNHGMPDMMDVKRTHPPGS